MATLRKGLIGCIAGLLAFAATAAVVLVIVVSVPDPVGLVLSVIASSIPAAFYAGVILRLDRYESEPMRTKYLSAAEVLKFRDEAFQTYFTNPAYLDVVERRFGATQRKNVEDMTTIRLKRKLLGD